MSRFRFARSLPSPARVRGATLVIALIMLVALALLAVWAFNSSTTNLRIVGNTQVRQEALAAVQAAIEATISSSQFSRTPGAVAANPIPVDVDGDGVADYSVTLSPAPVCYRYLVKKTAELDLAAPGFKDKKCLGPTRSDFGVDDDRAAAAAAGDSLCANTDWNVRAVLTDAATHARVAINQGVTVRVLTTDATKICQ